ncbi:monosaccharide ABC transporter ATP-binding protein, CUT2 family [Thalassospira xiamenensis M-5 = DSM 17429]|uniref:ABC transporter n=1 Tax=Thalassospira xiamenensis M-5 = DSM 17429 TaxID=1123366 RepID=A0AB72U8S3_9PROT|nr:sugar ABC transporter ATP-binding protein [Thalassospira xiamenensis]AJD50625.1 ABC transporter [Thalassospira xiamenensis M-5 = DSM 17429]SIS75334.1 monosaccharide ABC transporter ATP-binding protein, CUT2 family [Thalassospira xiamenensis M-5 = DSM 17429]
MTDAAVHAVNPGTEGKIRLSGRKICKSFGPAQVLFDVSVDLYAGEVHALLGENGAGKSTLVKILSGYHEPTEGGLVLDGAEVSFADSEAGEGHGVILIHQELNLAEQLSVEENIFLGREIKRGWFLDKTAMRAEAKRLLDQLQCDVDPRTRIRDLSVSDRQMVEIAKALSKKADILILDEPTAVLTGREVEILFDQIRRLREQGVAILYISHKLDEIKAIADRVTVLRDGRHIVTEPVVDLSKDDMARLMVGRDIKQMFPHRVSDTSAPIVLSVRDLSVPGQVRDASFDLHKGEVLGFAGIVGAGRTALMEAIIGLRERSSGTIERDGKPVRIASLQDAKNSGIAYLTKDRKGSGLLLNMDMRPNLTLLALEKFGSVIVDRKAEEAALEKAIEAFDIRAADRKAKVGDFSGGNQQKLLLAKVMETDPDIVIIDEPTRGIDIGTKSQIYHFIGDLTDRGKSVILLSSEMPEMLGLSDRIAVMAAGRITGILEGNDRNEHEIMRHATGISGQEGVSVHE